MATSRDSKLSKLRDTKEREGNKMRRWGHETGLAGVVCRDEERCVSLSGHATKGTDSLASMPWQGSQGGMDEAEECWWAWRERLWPKRIRFVGRLAAFEVRDQSSMGKPAQFELQLCRREGDLDEKLVGQASGVATFVDTAARPRGPALVGPPIAAEQHKEKKLEQREWQERRTAGAPFLLGD